MAQQSKKTSAGSMKATVTTNGEEKVEFEPVKAIEFNTTGSIPVTGSAIEFNWAPNNTFPANTIPCPPNPAIKIFFSIFLL